MISQVVPEIEIIEEAETDLEPLYRVVIHNDNVTPMDFVVEVLKIIFFLANDRAADIMLTAHIKGSAYVQTLPKSPKPRTALIRHTPPQGSKAILCTFPWNLNDIAIGNTEKN
jgi:ATP-dependent Clp protease adaptor protein ClpS